MYRLLPASVVSTNTRKRPQVLACVRERLRDVPRIEEAERALGRHHRVAWTHLMPDDDERSAERRKHDRPRLVAIEPVVRPAELIPAGLVQTVEVVDVRGHDDREEREGQGKRRAGHDERRRLRPAAPQAPREPAAAARPARAGGRRRRRKPPRPLQSAAPRRRNGPVLHEPESLHDHPTGRTRGSAAIPKAAAAAPGE